jgi:hypothetical protein
MEARIWSVHIYMKSYEFGLFMNQWQGLNVIVEMSMRIYKFESDKYGMNGL